MKTLVLVAALAAISMPAFAGEAKPPPRIIAPMPDRHMLMPFVHTQPVERWDAFRVGSTDYVVKHEGMMRVIYHRTWRMSGHGARFNVTPVDYTVDCIRAVGDDLEACHKAATL